MFPIRDDNPGRRVPAVTIALIVSCIVTFLWQTAGGMSEAQQIYGLGVTPAFLFGAQEQPAQYALIPAWLTIFSSMFLHGDWLHLLGNMLYLWIFGDNVEDTLGHVRFLFFYLLCGIAAIFANALPQMSSAIPMIGASGAISGVLGAYLLLFPRARVLIIIPIFIIIRALWAPAWLVLAFWFVLQVINSIVFARLEGGGVAWGAHIGGFLTGMLLLMLFMFTRRSNSRRLQD